MYTIRDLSLDRQRPTAWFGLDMLLQGAVIIFAHSVYEKGCHATIKIQIAIFGEWQYNPLPKWFKNDPRIFYSRPCKQKAWAL